MQRNCDHCAQSYEAKLRTSRFCSVNCRNKAAKARKRGKVASVVRLAPPDRAADLGPTSGGIHGATLAAFAPALLDTPAGQVALKLAGDVDRCVPGTPGYAGLVKELREVLTELAGPVAKKAANPLTLIRERHAGQRTTG